MFSKVCLQRPAMFCLYTSRNFPDHNLNFHCRWRWQDRIQATFSNIFYFTHLLFWSEFWCHLQILGLVTGNSPFNFVPSPFFVIFVVRRTTVNTITALTFIWIFKFSFNFCSFLFLLFYWKQKKMFWVSKQKQKNNLCTQHVLLMFWACSFHVLNW